MQTGILSSLFY